MRTHSVCLLLAAAFWSQLASTVAEKVVEVKEVVVAGTDIPTTENNEDEFGIYTDPATGERFYVDYGLFTAAGQEGKQYYLSKRTVYDPSSSVDKNMTIYLTDVKDLNWEETLANGGQVSVPDATCYAFFGELMCSECTPCVQNTQPLSLANDSVYFSCDKNMEGVSCTGNTLKPFVPTDPEMAGPKCFVSNTTDDTCFEVVSTPAPTVAPTTAPASTSGALPTSFAGIWAAMPLMMMMMMMMV